MSSTQTTTPGGSGIATGTDAGLDQPLNQGQKTQNNVQNQSEQNARPGPGGATAPHSTPESAQTAD